MRRQPRAGVLVEPVTARGIGGQPVVDERLQPRLRAGFARGPDLEVSRPVRRPRMQVPTVQGFRLRPSLRRLQRLGGGPRGRQLQPRPGGAPVGAEHLIGAALAVQNRARLVDQRGVEGSHLHPRALQPPRHLRLGLGRRRLMDPGEHQLAGAGMADQIRDHLRQRPPRQHQARAPGLEAGAQGPQRLVQPPAAGAAQGALARVLVQDVERDHRPAGFRGGGHRGIVGQPQVAPEQQDQGSAAV